MSEDKKTILFPGSLNGVTISRRDKFGNMNIEYLPEISFHSIQFDKKVMKEVLKELLDDAFNEKFKKVLDE